MIARVNSHNPIQRQEGSVTADRPDEQTDQHSAQSRDPATRKKFCEAGEGWCRVCEKMSDMPVLRSEDLLQGRREVLIVHGDQVYRLLCTRNGKLILQK
jgi:hemin uptake protein HemP